MTTPTKPLANIKVIELGTLIAGPFAARILAEFGADVTKIESPDGGDPLRKWRKLYEGTSLWWFVQARNKKSLTLNLKHPDGLAILKKLLGEADILIAAIGRPLHADPHRGGLLYTPRPRNPQSESVSMPRLPRTLRLILLGGVTLAVLGVVTLAILAAVVSSRLPDVQTLRDVEMQEPMYVYAADGKLMAVFGETRRTPITMKDVPEKLKQAFLATEDARFYEHGGVDYKGVLRAVRAGSSVTTSSTS